MKSSIQLVCFIRSIVEPKISIINEFTDLLLWSLSALHQLQEIYAQWVIRKLGSWACVALFIDLEGLIVELDLRVEAWPPAKGGLVVHYTTLTDYIISINWLIITEYCLTHSIVHIDITSIGGRVGWHRFLIGLNYIRAISVLGDNSTPTQTSLSCPLTLCLTPTLLTLHHLILSEILIFDAD